MDFLETADQFAMDVWDQPGENDGIPVCRMTTDTQMVSFRRFFISQQTPGSTREPLGRAIHASSFREMTLFHLSQQMMSNEVEDFLFGGFGEILGGDSLHRISLMKLELRVLEYLEGNSSRVSLQYCGSVPS